jgi:hypothetical protein
MSTAVENLWITLPDGAKIVEKGDCGIRPRDPTL